MRTPTFAVMTAVCLLAGPAVSRAQTPPGGGWVVLPVDEYRDLRTRAGQSPPAAAAADATLTRIDYTLAVEGEVVLGRAALVIDVLGAGWAAVPLPAGLAVREARLDGQPLVLHAGPPPAVHLSRTGRATLELDVVFTPGAAAGVDTIALPASSAAVTRVALSVPGTTHVVSASGGVVVERAAGAEATLWTVHGRPATPLTLSWARRRDDPRAGEPLRLRARLDAAAALRDTLLQVATTIELAVLQGVTRDLVVAVPSDVTVAAVTGALVDDWRVDGARLRITFLEAVASTITFVVRSESRLPAGIEVSLPMLRVPLAERETGRVSVDVGGEAEVVGVAVQGLEALDGAGTTASPRARAFQLTPLAGTSDRRLALTIARYAPEAVPVATVDEARYRVLASTSGALLVEAQYLVRNNQRSALTITLPAAARLWQARVDGRRVRPGAVDGARVLLPLDTAPSGSEPTAVVVSLVYLDRQPAWTGGAHVRLGAAGARSAGRPDRPVVTPPTVGPARDRGRAASHHRRSRSVRGADGAAPAAVGRAGGRRHTLGRAGRGDGPRGPAAARTAGLGPGARRRVLVPDRRSRGVPAQRTHTRPRVARPRSRAPSNPVGAP